MGLAYFAFSFWYCERSGLLVLRIHVDNAEDMTVAHCHTLCYLCIEFLDIGVLRIVGLYGETLEYIA